MRADCKDGAGRDGRADGVRLSGGVAGYRAIGPARDEAELEVLKAAARQRLAAGQDELGVGLERRKRTC